MTDATRLHATSVAVAGRGALLLGRSGSGKSTLALQMIGCGATLISDDQTQIHSKDGDLIASPAPRLGGLIEARGVGILNVPQAGPTPLAFIVDLDTEETARLPSFRTGRILGISLPLLHKVDSPAFPAALCLYLSHGRTAPEPNSEVP